MLVFGLSNFSSFFDIATKPSYSIVKHKFNHSLDWQESIFNFIRFIILQTLIFLVIFSVIIAFLSSNFENTFPSLAKTMLILSIGSIVLMSGVRILFASIDMYFYGEVIELLRRFAFLTAIFFLILDDSLIITSSIMLISSLILLLTMLLNMARICSKSLFKLLSWSLREFKETLKLTGIKGINSLLILSADTVIYNIGYVIASIFGGAQSVIYFGIWQRLYLAGSMFGQVIPDILVHKITSSVLKEKNAEARKYFFASIVSTLLFITVFFSIFSFLEDQIFFYWTEGNYSLDLFGLLALLIWLSSNAIQHSSGIFLAYHGESFSYMKNVSLTIALVICFLSPVIFNITSEIGMYLILSGCIYFVGSVLYFLRAKDILRYQ